MQIESDVKKQFTEEQYDDGTGEVVEVGSWPGMDKKERHGVESAEGGVARCANGPTLFSRAHNSAGGGLFRFYIMGRTNETS